nr:SAM-dependent methyltransferase [Chiayiivirga flava]
MLTLPEHAALIAARDRGAAEVDCSLQLGRRRDTVAIRGDGWTWNGTTYPYLETCKDRTVYYWDDDGFVPASRYAGALIKLVPTAWGPPTFEIDGIKMLPTAKVSPLADAERKVGLVEPRGKTVLDTCGGLGYFADCCVRAGALRVLSHEKNPDVIWLRDLNPWSPDHHIASPLTLMQGDAIEHVARLPAASVDAVLHDPPRFGIAGELYSQAFYGELARVLRARGRLFHYTGTPNRLTSGRDGPNEVATRLRRAGFDTRIEGDGVLATRNAR